ncbi:hypothetical protein OS493_023174 [Desmophyllum pertusum]|uniref:Uncharacterized protein n=1 Tax=Desmophyllum pertusum TaxID=174260 RepID=A0A9X0CQ23_9CNID|nr:hypothetical protein OS493_023174 [Desmophyllum pertusum]
MKTETVDGHQEVKNFCSRKLKIVEMSKQEAGSGYSGKRIVSTPGGQLHTSQDQPIDGNQRKIESLRIENLMNRTEKEMKSSIANNTFLKRKLEIAKRAEFEERLQLHMYQKDSATLLAKIVNSCTKASAPPSEVWERLLHKEDKQ